MKKINWLLIATLLLSSAALGSGKIQDADVKSLSELTGAGATAAQLINDTKIYVTANGLNKQLSQAIIDQNIGGISPTFVNNTMTNAGMSPANTTTTGNLTICLTQSNDTSAPTGGSPVSVGFTSQASSSVVSFTSSECAILQDDDTGALNSGTHYAYVTQTGHVALSNTLYQDHTAHALVALPTDNVTALNGTSMYVTAAFSGVETIVRKIGKFTTTQSGGGPEWTYTRVEKPSNISKFSLSYSGASLNTSFTLGLGTATTLIGASFPYRVQVSACGGGGGGGGGGTSTNGSGWGGGSGTTFFGDMLLPATNTVTSTSSTRGGGAGGSSGSNGTAGESISLNGYLLAAGGSGGLGSFSQAIGNVFTSYNGGGGGFGKYTTSAGTGGFRNIIGACNGGNAGSGGGGGGGGGAIGASCAGGNGGTGSSGAGQTGGACAGGGGGSENTGASNGGAGGAGGASQLVITVY